VALRPIADLVQVDHAKRAAHADERAKIHEEPFEPLGAFKAPVNQQAVKPYGVSEAKGGHREHGGEQNGRLTEGESSADDRDEKVTEEPKGLHRTPHYLSLLRIRELRHGMHAADFGGVGFHGEFFYIFSK
jgi:hypothetical protein